MICGWWREHVQVTWYQYTASRRMVGGKVNSTVMSASFHRHTFNSCDSTTHTYTESFIGSGSNRVVQNHRVSFDCWLQLRVVFRFNLNSSVIGLPRRRILRSAATSRLIVLSLSLSMVDSRAFPAAASSVWRTLLDNVVIASTLQSFQHHWKPFCSINQSINQLISHLLLKIYSKENKC